MEPESFTTDQLLQMYRHLKGLLPLLEMMLIQRGAINPISRYVSQTVHTPYSSVKVSA